MKEYSEREARRKIALEILKAEEDLVSKVWERLLPTLGEIILSAIFRRILRKVSKIYPLFSEVTVTGKGLDFKGATKDHLEEETAKEIKQGFSLIISEIILFLSQMTGNILVSEVKEVITRSKRLEAKDEQRED